MIILKTNEINSMGISCLVYGDSGIGKTTLAGTLEGKTLILSAESGLLSLHNKEVDYVDVAGSTAFEKINFIKNFLNHIKKEKVYDNIFIDSLTEINQIVIQMHFDMINNDLSKSLQAWGEISKTMKRLVRAFRDLTTSYNVVMICLAKTEKDELQRRFFVPDLSGQLGAQIVQYFDEVFYYKVIEDKEKQFRKLITGSTSNVVAKDRSGKLALTVEPNLGQIFGEIKK